MDLVVKAEYLPAPGETILGGNFFMNPGGKGANQAVAAQRLSGSVTFITKLGKDIFGNQLLELFQKEGLNLDYVISDTNNPSGIALITVDKKGENCIVVASGSNATFFPGDIKNAISLIEEASVILLQLEIPLETVEFISALAKSKGKTVILNPAPAHQLSSAILNSVSIITPNKKEAEMLSGISIEDVSSLNRVAKTIRQKGVEKVIITLGSEGAYICTGEIELMIAAPQVNAIDTTAAGDVFNAALAVALSEERTLKAAVTFACYAAALSVTKLGALTSAPFRKEADTFFASRSKEETS